MDLLIFDLDGTLIDSKLDLVHSVNAARGHLALPPISHELIQSYVGEGAPVLIKRALGPDAAAEYVSRAVPTNSTILFFIPAFARPWIA
jgi:phosphoglycolate phosphatase